MFKKNVIVVFVITIIVISLLNTENLYSESENLKPVKDEVLVVYDKRMVAGGESDLVNTLQTLLHGYNVKTTTLNIDDYDNIGNLDSFDNVFVLGVEDNFYNSDFINDLKDYKGKICWFGNGIEAFLKNKEYNLKYRGKNSNIVKVEYKNKEFSVYNDGVFNILEAASQDQITTDHVTIRSTIKDDLGEYPYIVESKNLSYISCIEFEDIFFYIVCDVLNSVFDISRDYNGEIFLDISDINYYSDPASLKEIADLLFSRGIKYTVTVTPITKRENDKTEKSFDDNIDLVKSIRYMQSHGGTVVLDVNTQGDKKYNNLNKYEFWNSSDEYIEKAVKESVVRCLNNGINPVALNVSNNKVGSKSHKFFKKYFSTYIGLYQNYNSEISSSFYPYQIEDSVNFNRLISQNKKIINTHDKLSFEKIGNEFDKLSIVDGFSISYKFQSYLGTSNLERLLNIIESRNFVYTDLKSLDNWVEIDKIKINSKNVNISTNYKEDMYGGENKKVDNVNEFNLISKVGNIFSRVIEITLIVFILVFLIFKKIDKNKFFRS